MVEDSIAVANIPSEIAVILSRQSNDGYGRIVSLVYATDAMFPSSSIRRTNEESEDVDQVVNTPILSIIAGGQKIEGLSEKINITFSKRKVSLLSFIIVVQKYYQTIVEHQPTTWEPCFTK